MHISFELINKCVCILISYKRKFKFSSTKLDLSRAQSKKYAGNFNNKNMFVDPPINCHRTLSSVIKVMKIKVTRLSVITLKSQ